MIENTLEIETKECLKCKQIKPLDFFAFKDKESGTHISSCKTCTRAYHREKYYAVEYKCIHCKLLKKRNIINRGIALCQECYDLQTELFKNNQKECSECFKIKNLNEFSAQSKSKCKQCVHKQKQEPCKCYLCQEIKLRNNTEPHLRFCQKCYDKQAEFLKINKRECSGCHQIKDLENFWKSDLRCKECHLYARRGINFKIKCADCHEIKEKNKTDISQRCCQECYDKRINLLKENKKECNKCHKIKSIDDFCHRKLCCNQCFIDKYQKERKINPKQCIIKGIKQRCNIHDMSFNLTEEDIQVPKYCPIFGFELKYAMGKAAYNSPSVDRIDNTKDYTKDNIKVISFKANAIKGDGSEEQHLRIAYYIRENTSEDFSI